MNVKIYKIILLILIPAAPVLSADTEAGETPPLIEGFVINGLDGTIVPAEPNTESPAEKADLSMPDTWLFRFDVNTTDGRAKVEAGDKLQLLPCATLEKIVADANDRPAKQVKLWARVTKFREKNFLFPVYFLPLTKITSAPPSTTDTIAPNEPNRQIPLNEPNDVIQLPKNVLEKLKSKPILRPKKIEPEEPIDLKQDSVIVDRTGILTTGPNDLPGLQLDSLGMNVQKTTLYLLPSFSLEYALHKQKYSLERLRFKAAGIVTKYKDRHYLLPQRLRIVYGHGNFNH